MINVTCIFSRYSEMRFARYAMTKGYKEHVENCEKCSDRFQSLGPYVGEVISDILKEMKNK